MARDGLYMTSVTTEACSAAFYIYYKYTKNVTKGSIAEHSSSANNYCAEILGGIFSAAGSTCSLKKY